MKKEEGEKELRRGRRVGETGSERGGDDLGGGGGAGAGAGALARSSKYWVGGEREIGGRGG